jgi:integrase
MNIIPADFLEKSRHVFVDNPGISLLDVRKKVEAEPQGAPRRDRLSALDAVLKLSKGPLHHVQASNAGLNSVFRGHHGPELGISRKRFQNIKSAVFQAVRKYGLVSPSLTSRIPPSPAWAALLGQVETPDYASGIRRLACFCTSMGVEPTGIGSQEVLLGFYEALQTEATVKAPLTTLRLAMTYWNGQMRQRPNWPQIRLTSPFPSKNYILPLSTFPLSFQADLEAWKRRQLGEDILSEDGPIRPLRLKTVDAQLTTLRRFASALVKADILPINRITGLADLIAPDRVKAGLHIHLERSNGASTSQLRNICGLLLSIARHYVKADSQDIARLQIFGAKLRADVRKGLTDKNHDRLKQFDDPANVQRLLRFPMDAVAKIPKKFNAYRRAKQFERAAAAGILIYTGIRMENLHSIQIGKSLRDINGLYVLSFTEVETKNSKPLQLEIPAPIAEIMRQFIELHRPLLPGASSPYLFPGRSGGPRPKSTMAADFRRAIFRHTGLRVNPHFMRHVSAKIAIDHDPSLLPIISQRLGHADIQTTMDYYMPNGSLSASRVMNKLLDAKLQRSPKQRKRK